MDMEQIASALAELKFSLSQSLLEMRLNLTLCIDGLQELKDRIRLEDETPPAGKEKIT